MKFIPIYNTTAVIEIFVNIQLGNIETIIQKITI